MMSFGETASAAGDADRWRCPPEIRAGSGAVVGVNPKFLEEARDAIAKLRGVARELVHDEGLADDRAHRHPRIKRGGTGPGR